MAHSSSITVCMVAVLVFLVMVATAQTTHTVLDNMGWTIPSTQGGASAYTTWAASKNFTVGDTLTEFDSCTATNTIGPIVTTGPVNITLDIAGEHYYICTFSAHCTSGQKLAISVSGSMGSATGSSPSGGGRGGSSGTPTRTSPTSRSPSGRAPNTPTSDNSASVIITANGLLVLGASLLVFLLSVLPL
ncbi:hypothetical protein ACHQM5_029083 [Ranunculus cassubicifolius]